MTRTRRRFLRPWMVTTAVALVVVVAAALSTRVVSGDEAAASAGESFDAAEYAADAYPEVVDYIDENAVELPQLLTDLAAGADEADYGNTSGASSAFAFPVSFTAVAGEAAGGILPVTVQGVPAETTVQLQIGPALNGTALRDVTGEIAFNEFTNQLEYQNVGTELNNQAKAELLDGFDAAAVAGQEITVTGAFLRVNPALVSVLPTSIEVAG